MKVVQEVLSVVPPSILFAAGIVAGAGWGMLKLYGMLQAMGMGS